MKKKTEKKKMFIVFLHTLQHKPNSPNFYTYENRTVDRWIVDWRWMTTRITRQQRRRMQNWSFVFSFFSIDFVIYSVEVVPRTQFAILTLVRINCCCPNHIFNIYRHGSNCSDFLCIKTENRMIKCHKFMVVSKTMSYFVVNFPKKRANVRTLQSVIYFYDGIKLNKGKPKIDITKECLTLTGTRQRVIVARVRNRYFSNKMSIFLDAVCVEIKSAATTCRPHA